MKMIRNYRDFKRLLENYHKGLDLNKIKIQIGKYFK